ncbi:MAG: right-handed parallel beta-helix repeat-containing protein [Duncaniella sp.]|nr:right-handed parallel beta-helix repeat-containing protein [Duncaniella sp.]
MRLLFLMSAMILSAASQLYSATIHVSATRGDDRAAGTEEAPLATPAEALKRAREWRRLGAPEASSDIRIELEEGVYPLSSPLFVRPEDSGTPSSATVFTSAPGAGKAVLSGGVEVKGWRRGSDDERIPDRLRDKIWVADAPLQATRMVETRQLYADGRKAVRASQLAPGKMERMIDFNTADRTITIPDPGIDLSKAGQLEMMVHQRWAIAILRVKDMTPDGKGNVIVTFHDPESRLEFDHPWPQPVIDGERGSSSFVLGNALEFLDTPGEWYQDYPSGKIYYYPFEEGDVNNSRIVIPVLETLVSVDGSRERPVSNVKFENIDFEHAAWTRPSGEGHVTLQGGFRLLDAYKLPIPGLPEKAELENQAWIARPEAALTVSHASGIDFDGCGFRHMGATGLDYLIGVSDSKVTNCRFEDIGGTALQMGIFPDGGFETHVPYRPAVETDICRNIDVRNNVVLDATNEDWGCVGIGAGYVKDVTIADNEVGHLNYSGICVGWGWTPLESGMANNRITGNNVHHFAGQLYDAGGIYTLSNQPGSVISGNSITDLIDAPYATNRRAFYIYFDEATDGFTVDNNHCPDPEFGYNRPGPALKVLDNGPHVVVKVPPTTKQ